MNLITGMDWTARKDQTVAQLERSLAEPDCQCAELSTQFAIDFTCPSCGGSGFIAVAEDEAGPCDHRDCTVRDNAPKTTLAERMAAEYAAEYGLDRSPAWWDALLAENAADRAAGRDL